MFTTSQYGGLRCSMTRGAERSAPATRYPGSPVERGRAEVVLQPLVVVHDRSIDADAGERRAAAVAREELDAPGAGATARERAEGVDVPVAAGADDLGDGVAGPECEDAEARGRRR